MASSIVFITGANTGLGLETVRALFESQRPYTILLGSRSQANGDAVVRQLQAEFPDCATTVVPVQIDVEDDESIQKAFDHIASRHGRVDVLINNADPRLLFITSGTSTLTEANNLALPLNQSPPKGWPKPNPSITAYRSSKTGLNMMMREWARILKEDGVKTWSVSPGFLATGLGGDRERNKQMGAIDPTIGAKFVRDVVEGGRDQDVGCVIRRDGVQPW